MSKNNFEEVLKSHLKIFLFKKFENEPIASASIRQVHIAYLENDTKVAVKLRRKNIDKQVRVDIKILNFFNTIFKPLFSYYTKIQLMQL